MSDNQSIYISALLLASSWMKNLVLAAKLHYIHQVMYSKFILLIHAWNKAGNYTGQNYILQF